MKLPNKLFEYQETVIFDCVTVMKKITNDTSVLDLYISCKKEINGMQDFLDALNVLFVLKKVEYNYDTRRISRVKGSNMQ